MALMHVTQIGPIDAQNRPLLQIGLSNDDDAIDLDLINNDLFHEETTSVNETSKNTWITTDDFIAPYFINTNNKTNHLWVNDSTVDTEKQAKSTILFDSIKELQCGDIIDFKRKPNTHRYRWIHRCDDDNDAESNIIAEGSGIITRISANGRKLTLFVSTEDDSTEKYIYCSKYDIIRAERQKKSNLFSICCESELYLIAQYLKTILPQQPWLNLVEIASFLDYKYQRKIYFDHVAFQSMVSLSYGRKQTAYTMIQKSEKACVVCTYLNSVQNTRCSMCNAPFETKPTKTNCDDIYGLDIDQCYKAQIHSLAHRGHPIFPPPALKRNKIYSKPFLPNIPNEKREHLNTIKERISTVIRDGTHLYKYQIHTVLWCVVIELAISAQCKLCIGANDLRFTNEHKCNVYNIHDEKFVPSDVKHVLPPRLLSFKGGIIADDVGLGKTLTMLSLIASDDFSSMFLDDGRIKTELGANGKSIRSAATLLIVPARLIEQWKMEILKHFKDETFTVVSIMTSSEHKKTSYKTLLSAHIVLIADECLRTLSQEAVNKHWDNLHPSLPPEPEKKRYNLRSKPATKYQDLYQIEPCLELIHWRRIVLDEAHDMNYNLILQLSSDFNWYISATPFPYNSGVAFAANFLGIQFEGGFYKKVAWRKHVDKPLGFVLHSILYNHLFSRHTADSILDDNYLPNIEQNVELIDLHPIERLFYELASIRTENDHALKRRICCGIYKDFYSNKTNTDNKHEHHLKHIFIENKRNCLKQIKNAQKDIKEEKKNLKQFNKYLAQINEQKQIFESNEEPFTLRKAFGGCFERYRNIEVRIKAAEYRINKIKPQLMKHQKEYELIQKYDTKTLDADIETFEKQFANQSLIEIVTKYGAKQAMILKRIRDLHEENEENHIIIFSSFNETLKQMKERLDLMGLYCVICSGTVYTQRRAIRAFKNVNLGYKQKRARIILLSVTDKASGADLNCATYVLLIDPVPGSCSEAFAAEKQAIGRAVRQGMKQNTTKVIRFVVKDSIEHKTYNRNVETRKKLMKHGKQYEDFTNRTKNQIHFYMNIDKANDENVNTSNVNRKKRKMVVDDDEANIIQQSVKKRKLFTNY